MTFIERKLPSLDKEGWMRPLIKSREASLAGADGVVGSSHRLMRKLNEPPRPRLQWKGPFFDGAATSPYPRRGVWRSESLSPCLAKMGISALLQQLSIVLTRNRR